MNTLIALGWVVIPFVLIGLVVGWFAASLTEGRGGLQPMWGVIAGVIGSFGGGFLSGPLSIRLFGEGPEYIVSLIGAAVGALLLILIVAFVRKWT